MKKEILVFTEENVSTDGITWSGGGQIVLFAPSGAGPEWLETAYAKPQIDAWIDAVRRMNDVFLAYSSKARATANDIGKFLCIYLPLRDRNDITPIQIKLMDFIGKRM